MAGLQSGNKIWEDCLRTSLKAMVNLRSVWPWNLNGQSQGHKSGNKIWEDPFRTNFKAKVYLQYMWYTVKILSDLEQEKSRSGSQGKVVVKEISSRSIPMKDIESVLINVTENKIKHKGKPKLLSDLEWNKSCQKTTTLAGWQPSLNSSKG